MFSFKIIFVALTAVSISAPLSTFAARHCAGAAPDFSPLSSKGHPEKGILSFFYPNFIYPQQLMGEDFYLSQNGEIIVAINGDKPPLFATKAYARGVENIVGRDEADEKNIFSFDVDHPDDMLDHLLDVYEAVGPIHRLLIFGHGSPGSISFLEGTLNWSWGVVNARRFRNLPHDLFAPNVKVVLFSCRCVAGYSIVPNFGINVFRKIFSKMIKQGGQVIASRRLVKITEENFEPPDTQPVEMSEEMTEEMTSFTEARSQKLKAHLKYYTLDVLMATRLTYELISKLLSPFILDWKSVFGESIVEIDIPPAANLPE